MIVLSENYQCGGPRHEIVWEALVIEALHRGWRSRGSCGDRGPGQRGEREREALPAGRPGGAGGVVVPAVLGLCSRGGGSSCSGDPAAETQESGPLLSSSPPLPPALTPLYPGTGGRKGSRGSFSRSVLPSYLSACSASLAWYTECTTHTDYQLWVVVTRAPVIVRRLDNNRRKNVLLRCCSESNWEVLCLSLSCSSSPTPEPHCQSCLRVLPDTTAVPLTSSRPSQLLFFSFPKKCISKPMRDSGRPAVL